MGRTGRMLAVEHFGVEPDMVCLAKGIASGMPLGALVTRADLMDWPPGSHASTFGGNPVSCRAAWPRLICWKANIWPMRPRGVLELSALGSSGWQPAIRISRGPAAWG